MRRKKKSGRIWKGALVVVFASALTTLAIHASDSLTIPGRSLFAGVGSSTTKPLCSPEMAYVQEPGGGFCIDKYEESAGDKCTYKDPSNQQETENNLGDQVCLPVSSPERRPWVNTPEHEALALCAKAGKRLPSNKEWYRAALGTPDTQIDGSRECALGQIGQSSADKTGAHPKCVSSYGAYDMVGNVWEWIDASVQDGMYNSRMIPDDGYVSEVDTDGVASKTATTSKSSYGDDYFFVDKSGLKGMMRGGFWSLTDKGGIFSINTTIVTSFVGSAVGFRCARDASL